MTIVALAGRRIDSEGATPARFPLDQDARVKDELDALLRALQPAALVCSAACGADLLALEVAAKRGIPARIVLPFERQRFRASSVTDRPGDWGPRFDSAMEQAEASDNVIVIQPEFTSDDEAYAAATYAILDCARELALNADIDGHSGSDTDNQVIVVVVWDGMSRGEDDLTDRFRREAVDRGLQVQEIFTRLPQ
jgi:hypothetical protein